MSGTDMAQNATVLRARYAMTGAVYQAMIAADEERERLEAEVAAPFYSAWRNFACGYNDEERERLEAEAGGAHAQRETQTQTHPQRQRHTGRHTERQGKREVC
eukprot:1998260-Rhodomonas_salina.1